MRHARAAVPPHDGRHLRVEGILQRDAHDVVEALVRERDAPVEVDLEDADRERIGELVQELLSGLELLFERGFGCADRLHGGEDVRVLVVAATRFSVSTHLHEPLAVL